MAQQPGYWIFTGRSRRLVTVIAACFLGLPSCSKRESLENSPLVEKSTETEIVSDAKSGSGQAVPALPAARAQSASVSKEWVDEPSTSQPGLPVIPSHGIPKTPSIPDVAQIPLGDGTPPNSSMLKPGTKAPDFTSIDGNGQTVRLSQFEGQIVVLDFWATWCGPCIASLPYTQEVAAKAESQGVVVLAVCTGDTQEKFEQFLAEAENVFPSVIFTRDPHGRDTETFDQRASRKLYGVNGIPAQFVIAQDGTIAAALSGFDEESGALEEALGQLKVKFEGPEPVQSFD